MSRMKSLFIGQRKRDSGSLGRIGYFPAGSVHIAVVDPGVGTSRDIIAMEADGHAFLAPDNGLLAPIVGRAKNVVIFTALELVRCTCPVQSSESRAPPFTVETFLPRWRRKLPRAGRKWRTWGRQITDIVPAWVDDPTVTADHVSGVVITIDHFGNLITNIEAGFIQPFGTQWSAPAGTVFR